MFPNDLRINFLSKPLHRIIAGGILASIAFFVSGILELQLQVTHDFLVERLQYSWQSSHFHHSRVCIKAKFWSQSQQQSFSVEYQCCNGCRYLRTLIGCLSHITIFKQSESILSNSIRTNILKVVFGIQLHHRLIYIIYSLKTTLKNRFQNCILVFVNFYNHSALTAVAALGIQKIGGTSSVTRKKSPNVHKSCPKMIPIQI